MSWKNSGLKQKCKNLTNKTGNTSRLSQKPDIQLMTSNDLYDCQQASPKLCWYSTFHHGHLLVDTTCSVVRVLCCALSRRPSTSSPGQMTRTDRGRRSSSRSTCATGDFSRLLVAIDILDITAKREPQRQVAEAFIAVELGILLGLGPHL